MIRLFLILPVSIFFLLGPGITYGMGSKPQKPPERRVRHRHAKPSPKTRPGVPAPKPVPVPSPDPIRGVVGEIYRQRYVLPKASAKLVDNHGNGDSRLYGTRNFRAVLNGVFYRGGGNNYYNKHAHRSNMNPLPEEGLENLCEEGFGVAVYLYSANYRSAPKTTLCRTFQGNENSLSYLQISPLDSGNGSVEQIHDLIYAHVRNPRLGPIYTHCWNGWHASGFVAATVLRQFADSLLSKQYSTGT